MRAFHLLSIIFALIQFAAPSLAGPVIHPSIIPRNRPACSNTPTVQSRTITVAYPRVPGERPRSRNSPLPRHSTNTFVWCSDDDKTYLIVELLRAIRGNEIRHLVEDAYLSVQDHIHRYGDGVISYAPGPVFVYMGVSRLTVRIRNASIGYTTWAALGSALVALDDFMTQTSYGSVSFSIHDETGEVGLGTIG